MIKTSKELKELSYKLVRRYCKSKYGKSSIDFKQIAIPHQKHYFLTVYGDLLKFDKDRETLIEIEGSRVKYKDGSDSGRRRIQFYKVVDGVNTRYRTIYLYQLMFMTFNFMTEAQAKKGFIFPINGNVKDRHIDNLKQFKTVREGMYECFGRTIDLSKTTLSDIQIKRIKKSKKTTKEIAKMYSISKRAASAIKNNERFKNITA